MGHGARAITVPRTRPQPQQQGPSSRRPLTAAGVRSRHRRTDGQGASRVPLGEAVTFPFVRLLLPPPLPPPRATPWSMRGRAAQRGVVRSLSSAARRARAPPPPVATETGAGRAGARDRAGGLVRPPCVVGVALLRAPRPRAAARARRASRPRRVACSRETSRADGRGRAPGATDARERKKVGDQRTWEANREAPWRSPTGRGYELGRGEGGGGEGA